MMISMLISRIRRYSLKKKQLPCLLIYPKTDKCVVIETKIMLIMSVLLFFRVLLRVRMLYYIKHEIIGDLVQHITDGVHVR